MAVPGCGKGTLQLGVECCGDGLEMGNGGLDWVHGVSGGLNGMDVDGATLGVNSSDNSW